jgi:hypothetical protein
MKEDDRKRGKRAVVCSIVMQADGKVRLVMDDAVSSADEFPQSWRSNVMFMKAGDTDHQQVPRVSIAWP